MLKKYVSFKEAVGLEMCFVSMMKVFNTKNWCAFKFSCDMVYVLILLNYRLFYISIRFLDYLWFPSSYDNDS